MTCLLYVLLTGSCLSAIAWLADSALPPRVHRRWLWFGAMVLSVAIPAIFVSAWTSSGIEMFGYRIASLDHPLPHHAAGGWVALADQYFTRLWIGWSLVIVIWTGVTSRWELRRLRADALDERRTIDGVGVILTNRTGPAIVGVWKPQIVVPRWVLALPTAERRLVLMHEEQHRRANDTRLIFAASALASLFPWILPIWWQLRRLRTAIEMDCDRRVVTSTDDDGTYAALLFKIARAVSRTPRMQPALVGDGGALRRRIERIVEPDYQLTARHVCALAVAFVLLAAVLATPHPMSPADVRLPPQAASR